MRLDGRGSSLVLPLVALGVVLLMSMDAAVGRPAAPIVVRAGFQTPESVLYDSVEDVYLVSNINGNPTGVDGNGFISRVRPDGTVAALKWIDGTRPGVRLNAPKGMAFAGGTLYVTDITAVRMFDRRTGRFKGSVNVPGSTFLNDAAAGPDGSVYITDTGLKPDFSPSGTDAVYRFRDGRLSTVAKGRRLQSPNGVTVLPDGRLIIVTFTPKGAAYYLTRGGRIQALPNLPAGQLDGVEILSGGVWLVSSWAASAVYRVDASGQATAVVQNVKAPADIGYDRRRNRVLIPLFMDNRVVIQVVR